jgi:hypothetical protein
VLGELNRNEHVSVYLKDTRFSFLLLDPCLPDIFFLFILFFKLTSCTSTAQMSHILTGESSRRTHLVPSLITVILYHLQHLLMVRFLAHTTLLICFIPRVPGGIYLLASIHASI